MKSQRKFLMEQDELTGQMIFPADAVYQRHTLPRDQQFSDALESNNTRADRDERILMNLAVELTSKGKTPNPDMSLEDWVDEETNGEYTRQITPLSW